jgi:hypothetical protein
MAKKDDTATADAAPAAPAAPASDKALTLKDLNEVLSTLWDFLGHHASRPQAVAARAAISKLVPGLKPAALVPVEPEVPTDDEPSGNLTEDANGDLVPLDPNKPLNRADRMLIRQATARKGQVR